MTTEVRSFIELSDIVRMRFECNECRAALELELSEIKAGRLMRCPSCYSNWTLLNGPAGSQVSQERIFTDLARSMRDVAGCFEKAPFGFRLKLKLKPSELTVSKSES